MKIKTMQSDLVYEKIMEAKADKKAKLSVHEVEELTGITVRTLHYYDEIGLLSPSIVKENGYRYYDQEALEKLQEIMFYRELDFSLKDIKNIMDTSELKRVQVLKKQKELLLAKRDRLNGLISLLEDNLKGEKRMDFEAFDMKKIEEMKQTYAKEVKERWGNSKEYAQSEEKTSQYTRKDWMRNQEQYCDIMSRFAACVSMDPAGAKVQELVQEWQKYITEYYYECTDEILAGLGKMYVADERFQNSIDQFGKRTAELISHAIEIFVQTNKKND